MKYERRNSRVHFGMKQINILHKWNQFPIVMLKILFESVRYSFCCSKQRPFRMKLFQFIRKNCYQTMGLASFETNETYPFNLRNLFFMLFIALLGVANAAYFFFEAKTPGEYGNTFYQTISQILLLFEWGINIWQMKNVLGLIGNFEKFIEKSQFKHENYTLLKANRTYWNIFFQFYIAAPSNRMAP